MLKGFHCSSQSKYRRVHSGLRGNELITDAVIMRCRRCQMLIFIFVMICFVYSLQSPACCLSSLHASCSWLAHGPSAFQHFTTLLCAFSPPASVGMLKPDSHLIPLPHFQRKYRSLALLSGESLTLHFRENRLLATTSQWSDFPGWSQVLQTSELSSPLYWSPLSILEKHPPFHPCRVPPTTLPCHPHFTQHPDNVL